MRLIVTYVIGLIFGIGISISGMANPAKVINFFDVAGTWDPSLAFVMGGALLVAFPGYMLVFRRPKPTFEAGYQVPTNTKIDGRLLAGSAVFGIGWGIAGFCPGGALPALGTGRSEVFLFVIASAVGVLIARLGPQLLNRVGLSRTQTS
ncbi:MAG: YeeE/YedE family protein [Paracoccaceae bacterium]|nr:YeeE/YedE family protein [Loktanella sp.]